MTLMLLLPLLQLLALEPEDLGSREMSIVVMSFKIPLQRERDKEEKKERFRFYYFII